MIDMSGIENPTKVSLNIAPNQPMIYRLKRRPRRIKRRQKRKPKRTK